MQKEIDNGRESLTQVYENGIIILQKLSIATYYSRVFFIVCDCQYILNSFTEIDGI